MKRIELRRRELLRGLGAGLALPFLSAMPTDAEAADGIKRILFIYSGNDSIDPDWWQPTASTIKHDHKHLKSGSGRSPLPGSLPSISDSDRAFPLADGLHPLMASLEPYKQRMLMLGRMKLYSIWGHWSDGTILVGRKAGDEEPRMGPSLDQFLADKLGVESVVGFHGPKSVRGPSWRGDNQPAARREPYELFSRHLAGAESGVPGTLTKEQAFARDKSVLDGVTTHLSRLKTELGRGDAYKLDAHLESIRRIEQRLGAGSVACDVPDAPSQESIPFPEQLADMTAVMTQILACNLSQVGIFGIGHSEGFPHPRWPGYESSVGTHPAAHAYDPYTPGVDPTSDRQTIERFIYDSYAKVAASLDSVTEGDGTLLDNTLLVYLKSMGTIHDTWDLLTMVVGGQNSTGIRNGELIDLPERPYNDYLCGLSELMGHPLDHWGDSELNFEPLALRG